MNTKNTDVVAEYLHEVDVRLAGLPVLQRRELLADLAAHIASERAERNIQSEGELIEVLERLGTPEVVAAAAHEEFGPPAPPPAKRGIRWYWPVAGLAGLLLVLLVCAGALVSSRNVQGPEIRPAPMPAATEPVPTPSST